MSAKVNRVIKKKKKLPANGLAFPVSSSRPLKFLDSVLRQQPQLGRIIRAKPCAVIQHPATSPEERTTPQIPRIPFIFPDYHTTACAIQCLAQAVKDIEVAREHVDHLSRTVIPSKPGQFFELIDKSRQRLDRIHRELDDTFHPIFVFMEKHFDLDELIEKDSNPKLIKKGEIAPPMDLTAEDLLKKEKHEQNDPSLTTAMANIENQPVGSFKLEDVFPDSQLLL